MYTETLYKLSADATLIDDETSLCVFDETNNLVADYDFMTGLRLIKDSDTLTVYINKTDLVPGSWVLFLTFMDADLTKTSDKISGFTQGTPVVRHFGTENPWGSREHLPTVSGEERDRRLSVCLSCPLLDLTKMTCTVNDRLVTNSTTLREQFCPEDKWGNKQQAMAEGIQRALDTGKLEIPSTLNVGQEDQAQFEEELNQFLEGL